MLKDWKKVSIIIMIIMVLAVVGINIYMSYSSEPQIMAPGPYVWTQPAT